MVSRSVRLAVLFAGAGLLILTILALTGCGSSQTGAISQDQYNQIHKGMTLDEVEAISGNPYRTHKIGSSQDLNIIWNYSKTEGEGLVRVSFIGGKVDTISPYEISAPEE